MTSPDCRGDLRESSFLRQLKRCFAREPCGAAGTYSCIGARPHQEFGSRALPIDDREHQRRQIVLGRNVQVGLRIDKHPDDVFLPATSGIHQGSLAVLVPIIDILTAGKQHTYVVEVG